jgi:hypothetical protein
VLLPSNRFFGTTETNGELGVWPPRSYGAGNGNAQALNTNQTASRDLQELLLLYPGYFLPVESDAFTFEPLLQTGTLSGTSTFFEVVRPTPTGFALGAAPARVRGMVLKQVAWMTLAGGIVGATAAFYAGRAAGSLLYEMKPHDPWVFASAIALLGFVALIAGLIPAHRASKVDPMTALRYE